jgi:predicted XRE-type DNA-binding protein
MKGEKIELVRGSGNVFRDLGHASPDVEQLKAILAAEIIKMLDRKQLTVRAAHAETGIAAADFSRIRNADLARFTLDRLVSIINRLGSRVEVQVNVRTLEAGGPGAGVRSEFPKASSPQGMGAPGASPLGTGDSKQPKGSSGGRVPQASPLRPGSEAGL